MGGGNPKRRTCRHCGAPMGHGEYVEIRVLDRIPETVEIRATYCGSQEAAEEERAGSYTRWRTKTMMTEYVCPTCAIGAVDRIKENRI